MALGLISHECNKYFQQCPNASYLCMWIYIYIHIHRCTHRVLTSVTVLVILGQQMAAVIAGMLLLDFFSLSTTTVHTPAWYQGCCHNMHVPGFSGVLCWSSALPMYSLQDVAITEGICWLFQNWAVSLYNYKYNYKYYYIIIFFSFTTAVLHYINTARVC